MLPKKLAIWLRKGIVSAQGRHKVYTRTGDQGTTSLFSGQRLPKTSIHFHALGTIDELNSNIGHCIAHCREDKINENYVDQLRHIQSRLMDIGAHVATPRDTPDSIEKLKKTVFSEQHTANLEKWIDDITANLSPLQGFVLPSGGLSATALHISRTVCRRCERLLTKLLMEKKVDPAVYKYVNRLSDYLFTLARIAAKETGNVEEDWKRSDI